MSMDKEGMFKAEILGARYIEHRFQNNHPGEYEIEVVFLSEDKELKASVYLGLENEYVKDTGKKRYEMTLELMKSKFEIDLCDARDLKLLSGKNAEVDGYKTDKGRFYYSFPMFLNKPVSTADAQARLNKLFGETPSPAKKNTENAPNPFENSETEDPF